MKKISFLLVFFIAAITLACGQRKEKTKVSGPVTTKEISVADFHSIGLSIGANIYIEKGPQKVSVKGQSDLIDLIDTKVKKGSWGIEFTKRVTNYDGKLEIYITMPTVKGIAIAGSGDVYGKSNFDGLDKFSISISGAGNVQFSGSADRTSISIAGSGDVDLTNLKAQTSKISIAGSGDADVYVTDQLTVSIAGSGDVNYKGSPKVKTSIAGSGDVNSMD